jgi:hypothetical protein
MAADNPIRVDIIVDIKAIDKELKKDSIRVSLCKALK